MKVLFVWRQMHGAGGVERISTALMNYLAGRGHEVSLLTWNEADDESYYAMDERISWHKLDIGDPAALANWKTRFERMKKVRRIVSEISPDVILNFESGIFFGMRLFLLGFKMPLVAAERNSPDRLNFIALHKKLAVWACLLPASRITVQFPRYIDHYPATLRRKMTAIFNPVQPAKTFATPAGVQGKPKILLCTGRLVYQKNIPALVRAFARLSLDFPDWKLVIAGDGADDENVRHLVSSVGCASKIDLLGAVKDVEMLYQKAHLFCLPSRWEGFPNALAEALSHGLPAVGYESCLGVSDLIEHEKTGLLAAGNGDVDSLVGALRTLMKDDEKRASMGQTAIQSMQKYLPEKIYEEWEKFLLETAERRY